MALPARMLLLVLALFVGVRADAWAQDRAALEAGVKATFLYRFAAFVEWPAAAFASPDAPVVVCIAGDAGFAALVERAASGERTGGRALSVRALPAAAESADCNVLYVAGAPDQSIAQALNAVRGRPMLTVTDEARGRLRGMIHFVVHDGRVRFHIDRRAAEEAGLSLNSRLLSIALSVRGAGGA
ncbi:MAG: YfiR family protein [Hyphomonadaceae bacterium]